MNDKTLGKLISKTAYSDRRWHYRLFASLRSSDFFFIFAAPNSPSLNCPSSYDEIPKDKASRFFFWSAISKKLVPSAVPYAPCYLETKIPPRYLDVYVQQLSILPIKTDLCGHPVRPRSH